MINLLSKLFGGDNSLKTVETIATEWIETDKEKAEAKTVMIKALDPNGMMRRQLSNSVSQMYKVYLYVSLALLSTEFVCAFFDLDVDVKAIALATEKLTQLFIPITSLFGIIVTASFGVNYANVKASK